jgi:hypothetical protein
MEQPPKLEGNAENKKEMTQERYVEIENLFKKSLDPRSELGNWLWFGLGTRASSGGAMNAEANKKLLEISNTIGVPGDEIEDFWDRYYLNHTPYPDDDN